MPQPTVEEFWSLLVKSRLVDAGTVATLRRELADDAAAGDVPRLARHLVGRGVLTRWQAKRLAAGNLGPFFLGEYRLLERHDRAGDALLFTARHEPSGRILSVVLLNAKRCREIEVWTEVVQRTTAASRATDPMLSRTWSLEQQESGRLIVCEHVEGTSLAEELDRHGPLPAVQAGVLVSQVARAVADLHAAGGVHGNLSLDVLRREPAPAGVPRTGRVRLLQFPLAGDPHRVPLRPWDDAADLASLGTKAAYVAPELLLPGRACDQRSDVYAIGAILHALVSGSPPCWTGDAAATLRQAAFRGPEPLGPPAVSAELATLLGYLMARDPDERYQTAAEAAEAVAGCLGLAPAGFVAPPQRPAGGRPAAAATVEVGKAVENARSIPTTSRSAASPRGAGRRRAVRLQFVGAAVTLAILAGTGLLVARWLARTPKPPPAVAAAPLPVTPPERGTGPVGTGGDAGGGALPNAAGAGQPVAPLAAVAAEPPAGAASPPVAARQLVVDDPALPWASPTEGPRPRLAYLPPGSQLILLARPADLAADPEGRLVIQALGPEVEAGLSRLAAWCGCDVADIESVQAGWQADGGAAVVGGYAVRLVAGRTLPGDDAERRRAWGPTTIRAVEGETVHVGEEFSFWVPAAEADQVLVVAANGSGTARDQEAAEPLIDQLVNRAAAAADGADDALQADLPRELEELVAMLDADRHLTLFGSPHYLLTQGRVVLAGPLARLAEPLEDLFGDAVKAAAVSAHVSDQCYLELDAIATLDVRARDLARQLAAHLEGLPDAVERSCLALDPDPYGRILVMRLPQMLRVMVASMRSGSEGGGAILNAYLPRPAGHNLALAAELALAQSPGVAAGARPPAPAPPAAAGALARLERKITLVFTKDTLEKSLQMIADEIGVPLEIVGPDLELEGITKNQSFGLDARDRPAREILREILAKANPDGKLVYVVSGQGDDERILVTTRAAAEQRGDTLPPGLEAAPAGPRKP